MREPEYFEKYLTKARGPDGQEYMTLGRLVPYQHSKDRVIWAPYGYVEPWKEGAKRPRSWVKPTDERGIKRLQQWCSSYKPWEPVPAVIRYNYPVLK